MPLLELGGGFFSSYKSLPHTILKEEGEGKKNEAREIEMETEMETETKF